ncbi:pyridoxamine 5'-phosphate oxidase family protein [Maribacter sp. 2307ULW6-5]|uniref:pyridoxamine 5'-phosphate oxidase family protein n=1 Tax=Maribacter sp. 2307ULW6-5 TaxID=3386275 RepID=UPI0039BD6743
MITTLPPRACESTLSANFIGRLAYLGNNRPHVVPTTYFYDGQERTILCFAGSGHRVRAMRKAAQVSFQVDEIPSMQEWCSVQAHGSFREIGRDMAGTYLKRFARGVLETAARRREEAPGFLSHFLSDLPEVEMPIVYAIEVQELTGKQKKPVPNLSST